MTALDYIMALWGISEDDRAEVEKLFDGSRDKGMLDLILMMMTPEDEVPTDRAYASVA